MHTILRKFEESVTLNGVDLQFSKKINIVTS